VDGGVNKLTGSSVVLTVDGAPAAAKLNAASGTTTISFTPAAEFPASSTHNVSLSFSDSAGNKRSVSWSFTTTFINKSTMFIEAEDFDYGHGQYIKDGAKIGLSGPYDGGSYKDLGTTDDDGFDYHADSNNGQTYRSNTNIAGGKENGSAGNFRGYFTVKDWWTVGWNDAGEWENYTRDFPTPAQQYEVFGHLASGGAPINIEMDQVTSGQGQDDATQVKKLLGVFAPGRATAGWDSLEVFPLVDTNGAPAVVTLGGTTTLRVAMLPGSNEDMDYFAFRPKTGSTGGSPGGASFSSVVLSSDRKNLVLTFTGTIESADAVTGPWTAVSNAASPLTVPTTAGAQKYYRVH
jgi:hypothetical protein